MLIAKPSELKRAAEYLAKSDPVLARVIENAGPCNIVPHRNYYWELIDSIISQQLSVKAAASIERRFRELFDNDFPEPSAILAVPVETLRTAGLSTAKATYIRDLAQHIIDGTLQFDSFENMSNTEIMHELTAIKGIGDWTAHMFLMFCMGRLDVLASGDLGIRNGIFKLYELQAIPSPTEVASIAQSHNWHPYETVACWYIWHSLDNKPTL